MTDMRMRVDPDIGLERALDQAAGMVADRLLGATLDPDAALDVARIRHATGLTQKAFSQRYAISLGTLRNWEQGRRAPDGPARALLRVIAATHGGAGEASLAPEVRDPATGRMKKLIGVLSPILGAAKAKLVERQVMEAFAADRVSTD